MNVRGAAALTVAKLWFLVAGYALVFALTRLLDPAEYGRFVVVNGIVSFVSALVIATTLKSVSRYVASEKDRLAGVRRSALRVQSVVAAVVAGVLLVGAPAIAAAFEDPALVPGLRAAAGVPSLYAIYSVHIGVMNGQNRLGRQAAFDIAFATLKLVLVAGVAAAGYGAAGALGGFSAAVLVILPFAHLASRRDAEATPFPWQKFVVFSLAALAFEGCASASHQASTLLVQRALGAEPTGFYGAGVQVARVAYQLSASVTLAAFPAVAAAVTAEATAEATDRAFRYSLILAGTLSAAICGNALELTPIMVGARLGGAGAVALVASPAYLCFALWFLGASILVATGRPRLAAMIAAFVLLLETALVWLRLGGLDGMDPVRARDHLPGIASASLVAHGAGLVLVTVALRAVWGWTPSGRVLRGVLVAVATCALAAAWRTQGVMVLVECAAEGVFAVAAAFALGVITPEERARLLRRKA